MTLDHGYRVISEEQVFTLELGTRSLVIWVLKNCSDVIADHDDGRGLVIVNIHNIEIWSIRFKSGTASSPIHTALEYSTVLVQVGARRAITPAQPNSD
jgi:hypothetical protein